MQKLITVAQSSILEMTCKKDNDAEPEKKEGKSSRKEQPEKKQVKIDVPNFSEERWLQLNDNCLSQVNKKELRNGKRLSDLHINYAQALLQKQFPELGGLHCSLLQEKPKCKISKGLQIVHSRGDHWIVVSKLDSDSSDVMVFDSMYTSVDKGTQTVIQNLFALSVHSEIKTVPMQKQRGGDDCGLYAIATATVLPFGVDPAVLTFQQDAMRTRVEVL